MLTLSNVKHYKGHKLEGYTARVQCGNKFVNVAYGCVKNNLIIHRWYRLTDDECKVVREEATCYFSSLAA